MGKAAGIITLRMKAGTAELFTDIDRSKAKIREFGGAAKSSNAEVAATVKALEGNFAGTTRAVSRFLGTTLGLGPVIQKAFPVVGAVLLGKAIFDTGKQAYDFFKEMSEGPERVKAAFRDLNAPLRLANDELAVTNDRLANDIAKLEGRRQNTLKLALDEARVAADKLAESLGKDLASLNKLLKDEDIGFWKGLFGQAGTGDLKEEFGGAIGHGGFTGSIAEITAAGNEEIRKATTLKEKDAAQTALNAKLTAAYAAELKKVNLMLAEAEESARPHTAVVQGRGAEHAGETYNVTVPGKDERVRIEMLRAIRSRLGLEMSGISQSAENSTLTDRKSALEAAKAADELTKPYREKMDELRTQLEQLRAAELSIGQPQWIQTLLAASGDAIKAIDKINQKRKELGAQPLSNAEAGALTSLTLKVKQSEADKAFKASLEATTDSMARRIRAQEELNSAIGAGYNATKRATIENQLAQLPEVQPHLDDPRWMQEHKGQLDGLRVGLGKEFDTKNAGDIKTAVTSLQNQIELERSLAVVQSAGAEAVARLTLAYKLRALVSQKGAVAAQKEVRAEIDLFEAQRAVAAAEGLHAIERQIENVERLAAAQTKGAEAVRQAALENKYADMRSGGQGGLVPRQKEADRAENELKVGESASRVLFVYADQLRTIKEQVQWIEKRRGEINDETAVVVALKDLERQRLQAMIQQQLAIGTARAQMKAFFLEMQASAKQTGDVLYRSMTSAVDRVSDELAKFLSGQKTNFAQMLQGMGEAMLRETLKAGFAKGITSLHDLIRHKKAGSGDPQNIGVTPPGSAADNEPTGSASDPFTVRSAEGVPTGTAADPFHVIVENPAQPGQQTQDGSGSVLGKLAPLAAVALGGLIPGIGEFLGGLFGGGEAASEGPSMTGIWGGARADGGLVSPSQAYIVGERGPEILTGAAGRIMSNAAAQRAFGAGGGATYNVSIDARGAEINAVEARVRRALTEVHKSAVSTAVRVTFDRQRRVPTGA